MAAAATVTALPVYSTTQGMSTVFTFSQLLNHEYRPFLQIIFDPLFLKGYVLIISVAENLQIRPVATSRPCVQVQLQVQIQARIQKRYRHIASLELAKQLKIDVSKLEDEAKYVDCVIASAIAVEDNPKA